MKLWVRHRQAQIQANLFVLERHGYSLPMVSTIYYFSSKELLLLKLNPDCGLPSCVRRWLASPEVLDFFHPGNAPGGAGVALSFQILLNSTQCISELRAC
jgi:hypothetical protein